MGYADPFETLFAFQRTLEKWSGGNVLLAGLLGTIVASLFALKRWLSRR